MQASHASNENQDVQQLTSSKQAMHASKEVQEGSQNLKQVVSKQSNCKQLQLWQVWNSQLEARPVG